MTQLAQNGKIWNPNLNDVKKKKSPRIMVYLLLAILLMVPSFLATLNILPMSGIGHSYEVVNNNLIQTKIDPNWFNTILVFTSSLLCIICLGLALEIKPSNINLLPFAIVPFMLLIMMPTISSIVHVEKEDSASIESWVQKETKSSVEVSSSSFTNSKIITTEKGKSYLLTSTGKSDKRTFTLKEIETKG